VASIDEDIALLEELRRLIDEYLFLGYAPSIGAMMNAWGDPHPEVYDYTNAPQEARIPLPL
jgi:hypothetical protein